MAPPHNNPDRFPNPAAIWVTPDNHPSPGLVDILIRAREDYAWPEGQLAANAQQEILAIEGQGALFNAAPTVLLGHALIIRVSSWAGNKREVHNTIVGWSNVHQGTAIEALQAARAGHIQVAMTALSGLPGLDVVISSKIARFVCPAICGAVDRHSSYFSNSIRVDHQPLPARAFATDFSREYSTGRHTSTRLQLYSPTYRARAIGHYANVYCPLLCGIAEYMNNNNHLFVSAAHGIPTQWKSSDVDMAMYAWWATNGDR